MWLPLLAHLIDTANVINALYNHCLSDGQRALLVSDGQDEESVRQTIQFIGFIHDLGKLPPFLSENNHTTTMLN
ncbi:HD domain-containing protein [Amylolactobacillus amylophilus]|uniref:HD domain-containing protein n=1 Tax=Amylolactobacillus amylophilus TaxID=1603 RepID=UPI000A4C9AFE|nr:HD domain-containing protein [Amylolactobacillus amylophilus]